MTHTSFLHIPSSLPLFSLAVHYVQMCIAMVGREEPQDGITRVLYWMRLAGYATTLTSSIGQGSLRAEVMRE
ncbi:hypothetical protein GGR54DRAFT_621145 [Hypoxylon sp. NC1633]|nr:hypothetical protein GGR54DRAFT_621145 [Hypoxylon sp. NC1633]